MKKKNHERRSDFGCKTVGIEGFFSNTEFIKRVINKAIKCPYTKKVQKKFGKRSDIKRKNYFICLLCRKKYNSYFLRFERAKKARKQILYFYRVNANLERKVGIVEHFKTQKGNEERQEKIKSRFNFSACF